MVSYDTIMGEYNTEWNAGVIAKPTFENKNKRYSAKYPNFLFIKTYHAMPIEPITQTADAGYVRRNQFFELTGVYDTYTNARKALQECKRIATEYKGWYIQGKSDVLETRKRYVFTLRCKAREYLQKSDW